ncbi:hypothetical protein [Raineyella sp. W15-4]|uniref:hypothetical protein n=1 Tax=Raineyella sp. W15-4 TaxID=3081651 RepID=UPI00295513B1|nr:hypothetical protein [Raineyella sp. W15-4]WOQ17344.1 hypothetical protein R0145_01125 [Raineyella sp. W15-4]
MLLHRLLHARTVERIVINAHPQTSPPAETTLLGTVAPVTEADVTRATSPTGLRTTADYLGDLLLIEIHYWQR